MFIERRMGTPARSKRRMGTPARSMVLKSSKSGQPTVFPTSLNTNFLTDQQL